jgi:hypothetical protein
VLEEQSAVAEVVFEVVLKERTEGDMSEGSW